MSLGTGPTKEKNKEKDTDKDAKKVKKEKRTKAEKAQGEKSKPDRKRAAAAPPQLEERAREVTAALAAQPDGLEVQHSATIDNLLKTDAHAQTAFKIFKSTNSKTTVLEGDGQDALHLEGHGVPEHRDWVFDDKLKTWRVRTTEEQIAHEKEKAKQSDDKLKPK
ncbi:MAG: hypothetical protein JSR17_09070 [Proteobacteria bacterium]|nr:hypothetical protein [Pseudomonadota bacterium]